MYNINTYRYYNILRKILKKRNYEKFLPKDTSKGSIEQKDQTFKNGVSNRI